jgi:hypothetical protein
LYDSLNTSRNQAKQDEYLPNPVKTLPIMSPPITHSTVLRNLKMENGKWKMENGKWKMENGKWKTSTLIKMN